MFPFAIDWDASFRPAAWALINGQDPLAYIWNPPWVLFPLIPFALLPPELGRPLMALIGTLSFALVLRHWGANTVTQIAFLLSPLILTGLFWGNVEWLVMLGALATPWVGLLLFAVKPQASLGLALWTVVTLVANRKWRELAKAAIALGMLILLSTLLCGNWWNHSATYLTFGARAGNTSLFPGSLVLGVGMIALSVFQRRKEILIASSPCFFPVVTPQVWGLFSVALIGSTPKMVLGSLAMWIVVLLWGDS